jgi:hypothetical protein
MKRYLIILFVILVISKVNIALCQSVGFLEFPPNARALSLAGAGLVSDADAFAIFNNSASMVFSEDTMAISTFYTKWLPSTADITIIGTAGYFRIGQKLALNFGLRKVGYQSYKVTDDNGNFDGTFTPSAYSLGIGAAYMIMPNFSASSNVHYVSSDVGGLNKGKAIALDFGFLYKINRYNLGLKLSSLGSKINYGFDEYSLPANLKLGAGFSSIFNEKNSITTGLNVGYIFPYSSVTAGLGTEYTYNKFVSLRVGFYYGDSTKSIPPYASAGFSLLYRGASLDFGYLSAGANSPISNSMSFGLGYSF